jgi:hypothetical protein
LASPKPQGVLLVGSVPLSSAEEVFTTASTELGDWIRRIPDGETGERTNWIAFQINVFASSPLLEMVYPSPDAEGYTALPRLRLREGADAGELEFGSLGYADAALSSYQTFARLKQAGEIPAHVRFQVSLPTPLAPVASFIHPESAAEIEPIYEARLMHELGLILDAVPADELAIQWDTAVEFAILEGVFPTFLANPKEDILERLLRIGEAVPSEVELGYHLCYGDYQHQHFTEPRDTSKLVEVANAVVAGLSRPVNWIHLPVPRDRDDEAYCAALRDLRLGEETELYLGLVHFSDGAEGTQRRIEAAKRAVSEFGVATECGFGRRPAETVPELMRIHASVAAPIR